MNLIGLPGQNPQTEAWLRKLTDSLEIGQSASTVAHYRHWDDSSRPDVAFEAQRLQFGAEDVVVAKSMGTMVLLAHCELGSRPARAVFIGTPLAGYSDSHIAQVQAFADAVPTLFIQQTSDVAGSYVAVNEVVGDTRCASMAEVAGEDHVYSDVDELKVIIEDWWAVCE